MEEALEKANEVLAGEREDEPDDDALQREARPPSNDEQDEDMAGSGAETGGHGGVPASCKVEAPTNESGSAQPASQSMDTAPPPKPKGKRGRDDEGSDRKKKDKKEKEKDKKAKHSAKKDKKKK